MGSRTPASLIAEMLNPELCHYAQVPTHVDAFIGAGLSETTAFDMLLAGGRSGILSCMWSSRGGMM